MIYSDSGFFEYSRKRLSEPRCANHTSSFFSTIMVVARAPGERELGLSPHSSLFCDEVDTSCCQVANSLAKVGGHRADIRGTFPCEVPFPNNCFREFRNSSSREPTAFAAWWVM